MKSFIPARQYTSIVLPGSCFGGMKFSHVIASSCLRGMEKLTNTSVWQKIPFKSIGIYIQTLLPGQLLPGQLTPMKFPPGQLLPRLLPPEQLLLNSSSWTISPMKFPSEQLPPILSLPGHFSWLISKDLMLFSTN